MTQLANGVNFQQISLISSPSSSWKCSSCWGRVGWPRYQLMLEYLARQVEVFCEQGFSHRQKIFSGRRSDGHQSGFVSQALFRSSVPVDDEREERSLGQSNERALLTTSKESSMMYKVHFLSSKHGQGTGCSYKNLEIHRNAAWYPSPLRTEIRNIAILSSPCIFCSSSNCILLLISFEGKDSSKSHLLHNTATGTPSTTFSPINASNSNPASSRRSESEESRRNNTALHSHT